MAKLNFYLKSLIRVENLHLMYDHKTMTKLPAPLALKKYIVQEANKIAYQGFHFDGPLNTEEEIERAYDYTIDKDNYGIKTEIKEWG